MVNNWDYISSGDINTGKPAIATFPLSVIDDMRNYLLTQITECSLNEFGESPYDWIYQINNGVPNALSNQEGLALKTYQSDMLQNWLNTEYIDGPGGISEITAIDTSDGSFTIDTFILSRKVYDMLNRIMVSGGTYDDWIDVQYDTNKYRLCTTPMYMGGLIKELVFQEVVSNSASAEQPLGTIAGRGRMANKHKGGNVNVS